MVLGGLWHGANWTYVIWGALHGGLLVAYWRLRARLGQRRPDEPAGFGPVRVVVGWSLTMALVCIGWVLFRADGVPQALSMVGALLGYIAGPVQVLQDIQRVFVIATLCGCLAAEGWQEWAERRDADALRFMQRPAILWTSWRTQVEPLRYALLILLTVLLSPVSSPRFIYFQF